MKNYELNLNAWSSKLLAAKAAVDESAAITGDKALALAELVLAFKIDAKKTRGGTDFTKTVMALFKWDAPKVSKWAAIGEAAPRLRAALSVLPGSTDSLYMLAKASPDNLKKLAKLESTKTPDDLTSPTWTRNDIKRLLTDGTPPKKPRAPKEGATIRTEDFAKIATVIAVLHNLQQPTRDEVLDAFEVVESWITTLGLQDAINERLDIIDVESREVIEPVVKALPAPKKPKAAKKPRAPKAGA